MHEVIFGQAPTGVEPLRFGHKALHRFGYKQQYFVVCLTRRALIKRCTQNLFFGVIFD